MEVNTDEIAKKCMDAINEKLKNLKKLNIIVVGKSGVGKSTLINSLFRDKIAETGLGRQLKSGKLKRKIILWQFMILQVLNYQKDSRRR